MSDDRLRQWLKEYKQPDVTKRDIMKARKTFNSLYVTQEAFTFSNGVSRNLIKLYGTIPVPYKGKYYNIPVAIWLMDTHPMHSPLCFVVPTADMCLKPSKSLDHVGKVYSPYLHNWNESSNLVELIQIMINMFSASPPVYSKGRQELNQPTIPYPTQSYASASPSSTGMAASVPYPVTNLCSSFPPYPTSQTNAPNFQYPNYPPYPTPATQPATYPSYPPTTSVSTSYPLQPSTNLPYPSCSQSQTQSNSVSSATSPSNTGTITDEHIRASLMSAIEDKIRRKINEQTALCHDEIEILSQTQRELNDGKNKLDAMFDNLDKEKQSINEKIQALKDKEVKLEETIEKLSVEEDVDIDEAVITTTPLYKQILNTHCEDAATEDTIYYIGEALRRGVIDLEVFIKQLRALSRKRLLLKSLLEKCRSKAGLPV